MVQKINPGMMQPTFSTGSSFFTWWDNVFEIFLKREIEITVKKRASPKSTTSSFLHIGKNICCICNTGTHLLLVGLLRTKKKLEKKHK